MVLSFYVLRFVYAISVQKRRLVLGKNPKRILVSVFSLNSA